MNGQTYAIEVKDLHKTYPSGERVLHVLKSVSLRLLRGEAAAICGESGSGKSTLLHILGTLDSPSQGHVYLGGVDPFLLSDRDLSLYRNKNVGFVFQHNNLLPEFTALENVMIPALICGASDKSARKKAQSLLDKVGLCDRVKHFPGQLSGGEQQRVAIARALVNDPLLILADEPSGNLDSRNAENIHNLFLQLNADFGTTLLIVTHNQDFAKKLPRLIEIKDGEMIRNN